MEEFKQEKERLITFMAQKKQEKEEVARESLEELDELIQTAGGEVVAQMLQRVDAINPGYYIGTGKVEELRTWIETYGATGVVCDDELSPVQMRNLAEALQTKVMDRTMIILDIFAQRARSKEGKLQVEIAQLKYQYSRLGGYGQMLSRQGGQIGSRGPGEKKLELDKRHIRARMDQLQSEIEEVERHRELIRTRRKKNQVPVVAIVGYTNAGKSTLLNTLSGSDVYAENQLFATLDPTTRAMSLPSGTEVMLTDTVGFIRKLPHHLVKAFYSTLEEVKYADIILHVMDASSEHLATHNEVVYQTLDQLQIKDIPMINVYNKIDLATEPYVKGEEGALEVALSARTGENVEALLHLLEEILYEEMRAFDFLMPYTEPELLAYCHQHAERLEEAYLNEGVHLKGYLHKDKYYKIKDFAEKV